MNIVITGRSGRMGLSVAEAVEAHPAATIHGTHDTGEELGPLLEGADAVIDFTIHSFTAQLLQEALATRSALVIGTTDTYLPLAGATSRTLFSDVLSWRAARSSGTVTSGGKKAAANNPVFTDAAPP